MRRTKNEDLCVEIALDVMAGKGFIDSEQVDDELIAELRRLYRTGPPHLRVRIRFKRDDVFHNMLAARPGEYLAGAWEFEQQMRWQRECAPRWECDHCGTLVGAYEFFRE